MSTPDTLESFDRDRAAVLADRAAWHATDWANSASGPAKNSAAAVWFLYR